METEIEIRCADGRVLAATVFGAREHGRTVAVVAAATGVCRRVYRRYAEYLAGRDLTALTFDYRGVGGSRRGPLRSDAARLADWGRLDLTAALDWVREELRPRSTCVVAHSVGGQILPLVDAPERVDGVVYVGAQEGYWGHWPMPLGLVFLALCRVVMPGLVYGSGFLPARMLRLGEDLPPGVGLDWARWASTRDYLQREPFVDRLALPALAYGFADDALAPRRAVDRLLASQPRLALRRRHVVPAELGLPGIGHFGFFRHDLSGSLWAESAAFMLDARTLREPVRGAS